MLSLLVLMIDSDVRTRLLFECPKDWRGDFLAKFNELVYPVVANKSISDKAVDKAASK